MLVFCCTSINEFLNLAALLLALIVSFSNNCKEDKVVSAFAANYFSAFSQNNANADVAMELSDDCDTSRSCWDCWLVVIVNIDWFGDTGIIDVDTFVGVRLSCLTTASE